jgi:uncharacterized RDD family membrane protein YckC
MAKPGLFRLFAAIFYDLLLLTASLFFATAILLPLNGGEAFNQHHLFYPPYLLSVSFIFYGWFWTHGGQTVGLKAWKIKLLTSEFRPLSWRHATIRFAVSLVSGLFFGLGFLWIIIDRKQRSWHDIASQTEPFMVTDLTNSD